MRGTSRQHWLLCFLVQLLVCVTLCSMACAANSTEAVQGISTGNSTGDATSWNDTGLADTGNSTGDATSWDDSTLADAGNSTYLADVDGPTPNAANFTDATDPTNTTDPTHAASAGNATYATNATSADNATNATSAGNQTNTTQGTGSGPAKLLLVNGHFAVVNQPFERKNVTEGDIIAASQANTAGGSTPSAFYQANLNQHNSYRAKHDSTPALVWDDTVAASAAAYASQCIWGHDPSNSAYGENLYAYSVDNNQAQFQSDGLAAWYNEISLYNYGSPGFAEATGHFTQVIWKSSSRVGCAVQSCPNGMANWSPGKVYLVCRYSPPGNYIGRFAENVMPVRTTSSSSPVSTPAPVAAGPTQQPAPAPSPSPRPTSTQTTTQQPVPTPTPSAPSTTSASSTRATILQQGSKLQEGTCLQSPNRMYRLCLLTDGRVQVLKNGGAVLWSSPFSYSFMSRPFSLVVQPTGQLSVMSETSMMGFNMPLWSAPSFSTGGSAPFKLALQNGGNVVLYDSRATPIWQTYTGGM